MTFFSMQGQLKFFVFFLRLVSFVALAYCKEQLLGLQDQQQAR